MIPLMYVKGGAVARRSDGALGVSRKIASGLRLFRERWDGDVIVSALEPPRLADLSEDLTFCGEPELDGISIEPITTAADMHTLPRRVFHAAVNTLGVAQFIGGPWPTVLSDDYAPRVRTDIALLGAKGPIRRARVRAGAVTRTRLFDRLAAAADGFHANGYAAFDHYRKIHPKALRYFDHRIGAADVERSMARSLRDPRAPLRIAFSGRLIRIKGIAELPPLAAALTRRDIAATIDVIGAGAGEEILRQCQGVRLVGFLDFATEWKDYVRSKVDLMFLPHLQGDSSSTYFESMAMGVPVLGFHNESLDPMLADGGGGWSVPRGDIDAAADVIARLEAHPDLLTGQSRRAVSYMAQRTTEAVFDERADDMRDSIKRSERRMR